MDLHSMPFVRRLPKPARLCAAVAGGLLFVTGGALAQTTVYTDQLGNPTVTVDMGVLDKLGPERRLPDMYRLAPPEPSRPGLKPLAGAPAGERAPGLLAPPPSTMPKSRLTLPENGLPIAAPNGTAGAPQRLLPPAAASRKPAPTRPVDVPSAPKMVSAPPRTAPAPKASPISAPAAPEAPPPLAAPTAAARSPVAPPLAPPAPPKAAITAPPRPPVPPSPPPLTAPRVAPPAPPPVAAPSAIEPPAPTPVKVPVADDKAPPPATPAAAASKASGNVATVSPTVPSRPGAAYGRVVVSADGNRYQIPFPPNSPDLPESATTALNELAMRMEKHQDLRLQLMGYAGPESGSASQARRTSLFRALAIRTHLMKQGVRSTRMDVRALGQGSEEGPPDRVDIVVQK